MATTRRVSSSEIVRNPEIQGGEPTVAGTRIPVRAIVVEWHFERDVDRLCEAYPTLTPAAIRAALAFYEANRAEIDRYIAENDVEFE